MINNNRDFLKSQGTKRLKPSGLSVTCPQCGAGIAYDQGRTPVARWLIRPELSRSDCSRLLSAWLWENYHGTAHTPEITAQEWIAWTHAAEANHDGQAPRACLADPGKYPELHDLKLPAGEYLPYSEEDAQCFALPARPEQPDGTQTIYMPAYIASFRIGQQRERVVIEAATGKVRGHVQQRSEALQRRWIAFGIATLVLAIEAFAIPNIVARLVVMGVTYAGLEAALGLVWEGLLWRT